MNAAIAPSASASENLFRMFNVLSPFQKLPATYRSSRRISFIRQL